MKISLTKLTYSDYQSLLQYVNDLLEVDMKNSYLIAQSAAYSTEIIKVQHKLIRILNNWSLINRYKKLKSTSITYMQAYILFESYDLDRHPIQLNERIMYLHKYLTNSAIKHGL